MPAFQSPRGTRDILPQSQPAWQHVKTIAEKIAGQMGYQQITVPTYENLSLFQRAIGEGTDVQDKELFLVRGKQSANEDDQYALRPEGTAGIVRAFIQHGMQTWPQPVKLFSFVNNFRYDRPQKGRYREHVQFDIEYFGDFEPFADAWVIYTTWRFLSDLGLKNIDLKINSLGTSAEREEYSKKLVLFCQEHQSELSEDSKNRIDTNPLRILDSKDAGDQRILEQAPTLLDSLGEESMHHFTTVLDYITTWGIPFSKDAFLVRGLDYYSHTAFEWVLTDKNGQQDSLGGGGRYDDLLLKLEGPSVGAVGAGLGLDRIIEELERQQEAEAFTAQKSELYLVAADAEGLAFLPAFIDTLFKQTPRIRLDCNLSKVAVGNQLKRADKLGAAYALVIGQTEVETQQFILKTLADGTEKTHSMESLLSFFNHED